MKCSSLKSGTDQQGEGVGDPWPSSKRPPKIFKKMKREKEGKKRRGGKT